MVDAVSTLASTGTKSTSKADTSVVKFGNDFNDFLKLLVTQLKNQDPTAPMDANQFTQQIVQFTGVEQSINTNQNLEKIISQNNQVQNANLVSYTGKDVEVKGSNMQLPAEGPVTFAYNLTEVPKNTFVTITDAKTGKLIFTADGTKTVGRNTVTWDGKDNDGNRAKAGTYKVTVNTGNNDGTDLKSIDTFVSGKVQGVNLDGDTPKLIVNNQQIALDEVRFIGQAGL